MSKDTRTYRVTVEMGRDTDPDMDRAVVTVNGTAHRYPYHWEDSLPGLARRAVTENYRVERILSVIRARVGAYIVTAEVF